MALNICEPYYDDGDEITGLNTQGESINGKRFIAIDGSAEGKPPSEVTDATAGGNLRIRYPARGGETIGVTGYDTGAGRGVKIVRGANKVVPVKAGAAIEAGNLVMTDERGQAVPLTEAERNKARGRCWQDCAREADAMIELFA